MKQAFDVDVVGADVCECMPIARNGQELDVDVGALGPNNPTQPNAHLPRWSPASLLGITQLSGCSLAAETCHYYSAATTPPASLSRILPAQSRGAPYLRRRSFAKPTSPVDVTRCATRGQLPRRSAAHRAYRTAQSHHLCPGCRIYHLTCFGSNHHVQGRQKRKGTRHPVLVHDAHRLTRLLQNVTKGYSAVEVKVRNGT
jgi:hypothetical protein